MAEGWLAYGSAFRKDCHQLLEWGYIDALPRVNSRNQETEITGFIAESIINRLDSQETDSRFDRYDVHDDPPLPSENRMGRARRRADIIIKCSNYKPRLCYTFEAKRLHHNKALIGAYVGIEGLQRFIQCIYAAEFPEAAMIGYVQNRTINEWEQELQITFQTDSKDVFKIVQDLCKDVIVSGLPNTWRSVHRRVVGDNISIYHIFLDCR